MSNILTAFNDHFFQFVDDILEVFPENTDVLTAKNAFILIRKTNPKMIVKIWKTYIVEKYRNQIEDNDITFFLEKDYAEDVSSVGSKNSNKIMESIDRLRDPITNMGQDNQLKAMKYIQNLTKLSDLCDVN
jgi:phage/plasmid-associated DNA primase